MKARLPDETIPGSRVVSGYRFSGVCTVAREEMRVEQAGG